MNQTGWVGRWVGLAAGLAALALPSAGFGQTPAPADGTFPELQLVKRWPKVEVKGPDSPAPQPKATLPRFLEQQPPLEGPPGSRPRPDLLDRPLATEPGPAEGTPAAQVFPPPPFDPPAGYTGPSGIEPSVGPDQDFIPVEDRWRLGFPAWDRYLRGHPKWEDYPYTIGACYDPFEQNVLKGDFPIWGQHTFFVLTATSVTLTEARAIPAGTTGFESTANPNQFDFFGRPAQLPIQQFFTLSLELFKGDTASFKPKDWSVKITPVFNYNYVTLNELAQLNPDVRKGTTRQRTWFMPIQEWFGEYKLADLSPEYDFVSVRAGSQFFNSDFRGFLFTDTNLAARVFGTLHGNRDQFNLLVFDQRDKDTNSGLNDFDDRHQNVYIANYFRQDFIWPGYTAQVSVHYNDDQPSVKFDKNKFLVRPDPAGVTRSESGVIPHHVQAAYLGWAGDGHIERYNITHQFYYAFGRDSRNVIANRAQDISALFGAVELSYDRDWARFRGSMLYSSGDGNTNNNKATGFDTILDNPIFAGGEFSFWQRQNIPLFGVQLKNRGSFIPDLRASKIQGQANFVNPGVFLVNAGLDMDLTPKLRMINNVNYLWFDKTNPLETFVFQNRIDNAIGTDLSVGFEYRPLLSNNVIFVLGANTLIPGPGLKDLLNKVDDDADSLFSVFLEMTLAF
jgi:hypothetical protein